MVLEGDITIDKELQNKIESLNKTKQNKKEKNAELDSGKCSIDLEIRIAPATHSETEHSSICSNNLQNQRNSVGVNKTKMIGLSNSICNCLTLETGNKLTNESVRLFSAANYLIQLFYYTDKKFTCTRTKLGKMLSVAAFIYAKQGKKLFKETIYKYNECGTAIKELQFYDRDIYVQSQYFDDDDLERKEIALCYNLIIPEIYRNSYLPKDVENILNNIFSTFASCSALKLGELINEILNEVLDDTNRGIVDLSKFTSLNYNDRREFLLNYIARF